MIINTQEVGIYSYVEPIATLLAAWLILNEEPTLKIIGGGTLICIGIYVAQMRATRKRSGKR